MSLAPSGWRTPLPEVIDDVVQSCPVDTRRALLANITLSGGSTMFKHFGRRIEVGGERMLLRKVVSRDLLPSCEEPESERPLPAAPQKDLRQRVEARTAGAGAAVEVRVRSHPMQRYAVWYGASLLGLSAGFGDIVVTREQYMESGPSIVRGWCILDGVPDRGFSWHEPCRHLHWDYALPLTSTAASPPRCLPTLRPPAGAQQCRVPRVVTCLLTLIEPSLIPFLPLAPD